MTEKEYKEATSGDVIKFVNDGDSIEGVLMGYEESQQYPDSFAVHVKTNDGLKCVFVSKMVIDKFKAHNIMLQDEIKIVFNGKKPTQDGKREYNDYSVFYR
jgi:hypothetical protein